MLDETLQRQGLSVLVPILIEYCFDSLADDDFAQSIGKLSHVNVHRIALSVVTISVETTVKSLLIVIKLIESEAILLRHEFLQLIFTVDSRLDGNFRLIFGGILKTINAQRHIHFLGLVVSGFEESVKFFAFIDHIRLSVDRLRLLVNDVSKLIIFCLNQISHHLLPVIIVVKFLRKVSILYLTTESFGDLLCRL